MIRVHSGPIGRWLLEHPRRTTWILVELIRPLPWRQRLSNARWQLRHYDHRDCFDSLWQTWERSR